jgi:PfaB family protein
MSKTAIIGISCLFPGANSPEKYYQNLLENKDCTSKMNADQIFEDPEKYYDSRKGQRDKYYNMSGGFIQNFSFDPNGFKIDKNYLNQLDDIHQWSLYVSREALKDSGYLNKTDMLNRCGIVLGNLSFPTKTSNHLCLPIYHDSLQNQINAKFPTSDITFHNKTNHQVHLDNLRMGGYPAMLVRQALGLSNIAFSLDAACATSLYAMKLAIDYLETGKADIMLAGAVSAADPFFINAGFSIFQAYSDQGLSCPLDKRTGGLTAGEGAGMVLLKKYTTAVQDGDKIYGVIEGIGLSNDGAGKFVLVPSSNGQVLALNRTYEMSGIKPGDISYIECHATGTPVGDTAEMQTLDKVFQESPKPPMVGSVKSGVGHLLTAAGMASLIKVILSMNKGTIPATINVKEPISSPGNVIKSNNVVTENRPFPSQKQKFAAINAFGFGGTNAHLILGEHQKIQNKNIAPDQSVPLNQRLAITGMSAYFGGVQDLDQLNYNIFNGLPGVLSQPGKRWYGFDAEPELGLFYDNFEIDFKYFKIPPNEISTLLPQQLLVLKNADKALIDADARKGSKTGVIIAMEPDLSLHQFRGRIEVTQRLEEYLARLNISLSTETRKNLENQLKDFVHKAVELNEFTSFIGNIMASRVSAQWDFNGPAFTVSEEENAFFRALELARMLLAKQEVDMMVVGAVDMGGNMEDVYFHNLLSKQLKDKPSVNIDFLPASEGVAVVVLRRSEDVAQNNQKIYAHLDTISISNAKDPVSKALQDDFKNCNLNPDAVDYMEVSGQIDGNSEYLETLKKVFNSNSLTYINQTSDQFGRLNCSGGAASLIKTALAVYHRYLPGSSKTFSSHTAANTGANGFQYLEQSSIWNLKATQTKRTASVCCLDKNESFSHVLISEQELGQPIKTAFIEAVSEKLFIIQAQTIGHLQLNLEQFKTTINQTNDFRHLSAKNLASYNANKEKLKYVAVFIASNAEILLKDLQFLLRELPVLKDQLKNWSSPTGSFFTTNPLGSSSKIAYLYPGIHSNYVGMWKDVFQVFPEIYNIFDTYGINPGEILDIKQSDLTNPIKQIQQSTMASIVNTYIVKDVLKIKADAAIGYSLGYNNLMFSLGYWKDIKAYFDHLKQSDLFKSELLGEMTLLEKNIQADFKGMKKDWKSYLIHGDVNALLKKINTLPLVFPTLINTKQEMVVSGQQQACEMLFLSMKCQFKSLNNIGLLHHEVVKNAELKFKNWLNQSIFLNHFNDRLSLYPVTPLGVKNDPAIHAKNIANTFSQVFNFDELIQNAWRDGTECFIELGPNCLMKNWVDNNLTEKQSRLSLAIDRPELNVTENIFRTIAKLISHGHYVDLAFLDRFIKKHQHINKTNIKIDISFVKPELKIDKLIKQIDIVEPVIENIQENKTIPPPLQSKKSVEIGVTEVKEFASDDHINIEAFYDYRSQLNDMQRRFLEKRQVGLNTIKEHITDQLSGLPLKAFGIGTSVENLIHPPSKPIKEAIWSEKDLMEFAEGKIENVFGNEYEIIDSYPCRVRLPMPPYFLVTRVTAIDAEINQFKPSSIVTEYDVPYNSWYSVDGQIPWAVAVESGQCDLLLISYMGIDFSAKGRRMYRLLDCTLTYMDAMPKEGDTLSYEINIDSFARQGETLLFFFRYDCFVEDRLVLKMTSGCAGFFTIEELDKGKGVLRSEKERLDRAKIVKQFFQPFLLCEKNTFNRQELIDIVNGEMVSCFGAQYATQGANPSLRFSAEQILMHDRITSVNVTGGLWGLGEVISEKDLAPDDWFFPCHFKDDQVMAGSLMAEGCVQLLQFYALYIGLHTRTKNARFQPIKKLSNIVKCRGQVIPTDKQLTYKMEVTAIGLHPNPYAIANVDIILENRVVVNFKDVGIELIEK